MHINKNVGLLVLSLLSRLSSSAVLDSSCGSPTSTVSTSPPAIYVTVTIREVLQSTVTVTVPLTTSNAIEQVPASVSELVGTPVQDQNPGAVSYDHTIWQTSYVTVSPEDKVKVSNNGPLRFVVVEGTTSWLDGAPTPGESLIYASAASTITLVPEPSINPTTTLLSDSASKSDSLPETGDVYGHSSSPTSSIAGGFPENGTTAIPPDDYPETGSVPQIPNTEDYPVATPIESLTTKSIDQSYTTLTAPSLTVSLGGSTTAVVNGETFSWKVSTTSSSLYTTARPPYGNFSQSTFYTSTTSAKNPAPAVTTVSGSPLQTLLVLDKSTSPSQISTLPSTSTTPLSQPSNCGVTGDFTLNFDDIPPLAIANETMERLAPMPLFNPYQKFKFSNGFNVVPPPRVPYLPSSKPLLLEFKPKFLVNVSNEDTGPNSREFGWSGYLGNADQGLSGCFSYNIYGASLGCDSRSDDCVFSFTGYQSDRTTKLNKEVAHQLVNVPACPTLVDCSLTSIDLDDTFANLDLVSMNVTVGGEPKNWWIDDIRLGWSNNTCSAGLCRQRSRIH